MIKADELRELRPVVRYANGLDMTLSSIQYAIEDLAGSREIPVAFYSDQVKMGGLFNSSVDDCIVLYHPDHLYDYFKFCIRVTYQGTYAFVTINDFGQSKQLNKAARATAAAEDRRGKSLSYKITSKIADIIVNAGRNEQKREMEENYYHCVFDIFDELIS